ncbi:MAG TPA: OmpA family protein [Steroidobacteraceae bacterium]|jgi:outer membrane protein OmpA-like peptidoglycan-associated protein|nr:OmpA family protein [Steroidobacteraceae bacterium]
MKMLSNTAGSAASLVAAAVAVALLAGCASAPRAPDGAAAARSKLTQLQSDPQLATLAPVAMKDADSAVRAAEQPQKDADLAAHRVYLADSKIEIARSQAQTRYAEDQRVELTAQREAARLASRTREADLARGQVASARAEGAEQKLAADQARTEAEAARSSAAMAAAQADELQRQIADLQAKATDRGLVLTLGDVLFATGKADLKSGATGNLNKLVTFLSKYADRTVLIEGYTDSVGSDEFNQGLSQRRAESVQSYLVGQGIGAPRLAASGKGESSPVADNESASGRQQNRRVEVVIRNTPLAMRQ